MFLDPFGLASVSTTEYAKAMGADVSKPFTDKDGKTRITITYGKVKQDYYVNSGTIDDTVLNAKFGWASFLTDNERKAEVGISIITSRLYKDFSLPINAALKNAESTFSAKGNKRNYGWFTNQVNHNKPWDIKLEDRWNETIADDTYPGQSTQIVVNGQITSPHELGNVTYGYLGTVCGFTEFELLKGGDYANSSYNGGFWGGVWGAITSSDPAEDKTEIRIGINWYKNRN